MRTVLIFVGALLAAAVQAQEPSFPHRGPIEITVLFPAGTSADVTARLLADGMSKQLGAKVIVFNRPGAGGAIGYKYVASQKADGYSIVWNSNSISTTFHSGLLPFDYHEFDAVARVLVESPVIAVRGESKWKTLGQLVADAKSHPKGITVGNSGIGSHTHISSVALFRAAGVEAVDVPFGAAQVVPSLLGGQVDAVLQLPAALSGYVKSGQVRLLASLTSRCAHCARAGFRRFARGLARHRGAERHAEGRHRRPRGGDPENRGEPRFRSGERKTGRASRVHAGGGVPKPGRERRRGARAHHAAHRLEEIGRLNASARRRRGLRSPASPCPARAWTCPSGKPCRLRLR